MPLPVSLKEVAEEISTFGKGEGYAYLNRLTGELYNAPIDDIAFVEDADDEDLADEGLHEWQRERNRKLAEILVSADWLRLPQIDTGESFRFMERFCDERCESRLREALLSSLGGRGSFGRFRAAVEKHGVLEAWYEFKNECLAEIARQWLEGHAIAFVE